MVIGRGYTDRDLTDDEAREIVREGLGTLAVDGKRVLILIPDGTRTMPMPLMFDLFRELLVPRAAAMDYLVALGTHQPMSDAQLSKLVGQTVVNGQVGRSHVFNHEWGNPSNLVTLGVIPADAIRQITGGLMAHSGLRPAHHLRAGLSARGGWLFRRDQILFPWHRRAGDYQLYSLAGGRHHQLQSDRLGLYAGARRH
jgi:hypothetical protein